MDEGRLRLKGFSWTASAVFQALPMLATAGLMLFLGPGDGAGRDHPADPRVGDPRALRQPRARRWSSRKAARGRRRRRRPRSGCSATSSATTRASCTRRTGLVLERGAFGVWLVGEAGALLVRGRRVHCWCVRATDPALPSSDRIAHLLLALRADEAGLRDRRQPRLRGRALARAPAAAQARPRPALRRARARLDRVDSWTP